MHTHNNHARKHISLPQDIIENIITPAEEMMRRRRSVSSSGVLRNSVVGALFRGGADDYHPLGSLPAFLLPLLVGIKNW